MTDLKNSDLKVLESRTQVRFNDCDPFGHLNNAQYLNYFINAREDQTKLFYNLDVYELISEDFGWVVAQHEIAYMRPALLKEIVAITSQTIDFSLHHLTVEMKMYNTQKTKIKAILWTKYVPVNIKTGRRTTHQAFMMDFLNEINLPVLAKNFDERVKNCH